MTRRIFSFDPPDRFVCGAIGQPGQRTFFLQASRGSQVVSVALEKAQVAVLAERLALLLLALRESGVQLPDEDLLQHSQAALDPLVEPVEEQFRVGVLTLAWDEQRERVVIEAREMTGEEELEEEPEDEEAEALLAQDGAEGPDMVRVLLEPTEARSFVTGAVAVVQAGRPPCPICGEPLDPGGHFCARRNGYTH